MGGGGAFLMKQEERGGWVWVRMGGGYELIQSRCRFRLSHIWAGRTMWSKVGSLEFLTRRVIIEKRLG